MRIVGVVAATERSVGMDAHALGVKPFVRALCAATTGSPWWGWGWGWGRGLEFAVTLLLLLGAVADIRGVLPNAHGAFPRPLCPCVAARRTEHARLIRAELFDVSAVAAGRLQVVLGSTSAGATSERALPPGSVAVLIQRLVTALSEITGPRSHSCNHSCGDAGTAGRRNDRDGSDAHFRTRADCTFSPSIVQQGPQPSELTLPSAAPQGCSEGAKRRPFKCPG